MKKFTIASILLASSLFAINGVPLKQGWNLVGAVDDINPQSISCAKTIWTYRDGGWNLYIQNDTSADNHGFPQIGQISKGEGFWVNADSNCVINFSDSGYIPTNEQGDSYFAYGHQLQDRKSDARYAVSNSLGTNLVVFDANNSTFTLSAYRNDNNDSRAGLVLQDSNITSAQATLKLTTDGTTGENRAQLNACNMKISGNTDLKASAGIVVKPSSISVWYEIDNPDGTWIDVYDKKILENTTMKDKDLNVRITVDGTKIVYSIVDAINGTSIATETYDTETNTSATIASGIGCVEVRARVKDDGDLSVQAADNTVVTLKDLKVVYAPPFETEIVGTLDFTSLTNFVMFESNDADDDLEYTKISKNGNTISVTDYEYDGSSWSSEEVSGVTINGDTVTLPDGEKIKFSIYSTKKAVNNSSLSDLYISDAFEKVVVGTSEYEVDTWDWTNPTYFDPADNQQKNITDLDLLIAGFTTSGNNGEGMWFGGDENPMFLNQDHKVVQGRQDGNYDDGHPRYVRTEQVVGTWTSDGTYISVDTPSEALKFRIIQEGEGYYIEESSKDKIGAVTHDIILTGSNATDDAVQGFLTSHN